MRENIAAVLAFSAAVGIAAAACGSSSAAKDAGPPGDAPVDIGGAASCDPVAQTCGAGMKCDFGCQGTTAVVACWPNGDGGIGAACTNLATCAAGTACIALPTAGTSCRRYCNGDGDCATGERCHNDTVSVGCGAVTSLSLHLCH